jgi:hypothetical protein
MACRMRQGRLISWKTLVTRQLSLSPSPSLRPPVLGRPLPHRLDVQSQLSRDRLLRLPSQRRGEGIRAGLSFYFVARGFRGFRLRGTRSGS